MIAVEGLSEGERDATLGTRGAVEARDIARRPRFSFDFVVGSNFCFQNTAVCHPHQLLPLYCTLNILTDCA